MTPKRRFTTTKVRGQASGDRFDGTPAPTSLDTAVITRIYVNFASCITALEVHYDKGSVRKITHGTPSGNRQEILLPSSELITSIELSSEGERINHLTFFTNKRTLGPFGERKGEFFQLHGGGSQFPSETPPRMGLVAFRGTYRSTFITSLQATFAEFPQQPLGTARYEKLQTAANAKSPSEVSSLPSFAVHLMSPVIKLLVGSEPAKLHVHEDTLCRLPFFRAALKGDFKEAAEGAVKMPEDDVAPVAALVEFLSVGVYTYAYNPDTARFRGSSRAPGPILRADLAQGLFHVAVYATASKYDCAKLVDEAVFNFRVVVAELDGIDVLRLWQAAYAAGLTMAAAAAASGGGGGAGVGGSLAGFGGGGRGLAELRASLSEKHREEMEMILGDYPALACDLLGFSNVEDSDSYPGDSE